MLSFCTFHPNIKTPTISFSRSKLMFHRHRMSHLRSHVYEYFLKQTIEFTITLIMKLNGSKIKFNSATLNSYFNIELVSKFHGNLRVDRASICICFSNELPKVRKEKRKLEVQIGLFCRHRKSIKRWAIASGEAVGKLRLP